MCERERDSDEAGFKAMVLPCCWISGVDKPLKMTWRPCKNINDVSSVGVLLEYPCNYDNNSNKNTCLKYW